MHPMLSAIGPGEVRFAWMDQIDNGFLVNYRVPVKRVMKHPPLHGGPFGAPGQALSDDDAPAGVFYETSVKTVYCRDFKEITAAVEMALMAQKEYVRLEKDGKMNAFHPGPETAM